MKLSIIISLYNKKNYIEACLRSVLDQDISEQEYEIIVVNDGSTDLSENIVEPYSIKYENVHLINQVNGGPSAARNNGYDLAKGEYVYFLDADDNLAPNVLGYLLNVCSQYNLDILEFNTTSQIENNPDIESNNANLKNLDIEVLDGISFVAKNGFRNEAWRYFIKREIMSQSRTRFIEGTLFEDAIFSATVFLKSKRVCKIKDEVHRYIVVEDSIVTSTDQTHNLKFIKGMLFAVEQYDELIKELNPKHKNYIGATKRLKAKQQSLVLTFLIRFFKFRLLDFKELKSAINKFKSLETYPLKPSIGGIPKDKINYLPLFNNPRFLFTVLIIKRFLPF